jgi:hypothetical protein
MIIIPTITPIISNIIIANINNNFKNNKSKSTESQTVHQTINIYGNNNTVNNHYNNQYTTTPTFPNNHNNYDIYESLEITIKKIDNYTYTGKINSIEQNYKKITFQNENLKQKFNLQATKNSKYIVSVLVNYNPNNTIKNYEITEYLGTTD